LGKTVESTNQQKPAGDAESVNFNTRQGSVQPKTQPATISNDTLTGNSVVSRVQEQITAGGQQGGVEAANNANNGRVKDKAGSDSQKASRQLSGDGQGAGGISEKLNVEKAELSSGIINTPKSESGSNSAHNSPAQTGGFSSVQTTAAAPPVIAGSSAKNSANVPVQDNVASIREQIYQSVRSSIQQGDSQITIRLNPPELGQVSVKFSERGNELTGLLEATNPQTRAEIRQAIPEIIRSLEESGINIKRIDVMLSDSPRQSAQQQSSRDNASADLWEQLSQQGFQDTPGNRASHDSYLTPTYSDNPGAPENDAYGVASFSRNQAQPSDNLLDVLI
jgi:flagellar hook-length control protein FliK